MLTQPEILRNNSKSVLPSPTLVEDKTYTSWFGKVSQYCTILIPDYLIKNVGKMSGQQIQAWREKVALCMLVACNCMFLGMMTYGVNKFICRNNVAQMVYGQLNKKMVKGNNTCVADGGIYYSDIDYGFSNQTHLTKKNVPECRKAFGKQLVKGGSVDVSDMRRINDMYYSYTDIENLGMLVIDGKVYDPTYCTHPYFKSLISKYKGGIAVTNKLNKVCLECFKKTFYSGRVSCKTNGCVFADIMLWISTVTIFGVILIKFFLAMIYAWYSKLRPTTIRNTTPVILQVTCYCENEMALRATLDSLVKVEYNEDYKLIIVIADGDIKGQGEIESTPDILRRICDVDDGAPMSYLSLAPGHRRQNRATVHTGYYVKDNQKSKIMLILKCGNEKETAKAGNRGKRDSQVIVMSFFSKLLYNERLSPLDHEIYKKMSNIVPACLPSDFEILQMIDADTVVHPDALIKMVAAFEHDPKIMGLCGETQIINKNESWVTRIQVFEYYISHHLAKNFESVFGGVTCLPGCFCIYRIKITTDENDNIKNHTDKKCLMGEKWNCLPILVNPLILSSYSVYEARTLHEKNLLHLGEDRYLTTLLMKNFYKRKLIFLSSAKCSTYVPTDYATLRSQRRRWINSTIHNMFELVIVNKLCGTFCFSMQFVIFFELFGTLTLPAAIFFTGVLLGSAILGQPAWIPLVMLAAILGLPAVLIMLTTFELSYWLWLIVYIFALPVWNFCLPIYAFWKFDDFSWGDTRKIEAEGVKDELGVFDPASVKLSHLNDKELI